MVWVIAGGLTPAGNKISSLRTSNGLSQFYTGKMQWWNYFAFVFDDELKNGTIDLKPFLDYLKAESLVSPSNYLASVEFGTEIASGRGSLSLNRYTVTIS